MNIWFPKLNCVRIGFRLWFLLANHRKIREAAWAFMKQSFQSIIILFGFSRLLYFTLFLILFLNYFKISLGRISLFANVERWDLRLSPKLNPLSFWIFISLRLFFPILLSFSKNFDYLLKLVEKVSILFNSSLSSINPSSVSKLVILIGSSSLLIVSIPLLSESD